MKYYRSLGAEIEDSEIEFNGMQAQRINGFWNIKESNFRITNPMTQNEMDLIDYKEKKKEIPSKYFTEEWYGIEID
jgi:hypothetical protein